MSTSMRERILAVYRGEEPETVPFMLDLSHWFYHRNRISWDLSRAYERPEDELIAYHGQMGVGFYMANLASFYEVRCAEDVKATVSKSGDGREIVWQYDAPAGSLRRRRVWHEDTYSWAIPDWGIRDRDDLELLGRVLGGRTFSPRWDRYRAWAQAVGDNGTVYLGTGYSAMGYLLNYWMGIEGTMYAVSDWPETLHRVVDRINANNLALIDLLAQSPAEVITMGDNFSSDIQPPHFFDEWSRPYYREAITRLHAAGKYVAVHIDGRLRGALRMIADVGADCADAVTPTPMGDLTPGECRQDAGDELILSGGGVARSLAGECRHGRFQEGGDPLAGAEDPRASIYRQRRRPGASRRRRRADWHHARSGGRARKVSIVSGSSGPRLAREQAC